MWHLSESDVHAMEDFQTQSKLRHETLAWLGILEVIT